MYWEIIELEDGAIALRQMDESGEPMVTIRFSEEAKARLNDRHIDVAKAMFSAGMQWVSQIEDPFEDLDEEMPEIPVVH
ncbi:MULTISPECIES: hypothetical protein [Gynuella]|uniref:Uncharacterized protein n=1 Tax=Gynuella sunshinyii YC6258 TaxID=1445510 RepID=A0A0C5VL12_9GAMM|nr:hypothetical protein [Gynuella sunshinyii]AJQ95382.1 hypothetical Protein YC6258_03346 [Gynuella sunshinyii YC6258]